MAGAKVDVPMLQAFLDAFNARDVDAIMAFFAEDCVMDMPRGPAPGGRRLVGKEQVREGIRSRLDGIPDIHYGNDRHWVVRRPRRVGVDAARHAAERRPRRGARVRSARVQRGRKDQPQGLLLEDRRLTAAAAGPQRLRARRARDHPSGRHSHMATPAGQVSHCGESSTSPLTIRQPKNTAIPNDPTISKNRAAPSILRSRRNSSTAVGYPMQPASHGWHDRPCA